MTLTIRIVLIVAIAVQTVGCSTWRPLARVTEIPDDDRQASMREQVMGAFIEGMRVRIRIRKGAGARVKGQLIECEIKKVDLTSLTVTQIGFFDRNHSKRDLTLNYADIENIEYRDGEGLWGVFIAGVAGGAVLYIAFVLWSLRGIELD